MIIFTVDRSIKAKISQITGQDCEGAGEMFQVTTMDLNKIAEEGKVDYEQDFFKKPGEIPAIVLFTG